MWTALVLYANYYKEIGRNADIDSTQLSEDCSVKLAGAVSEGLASCQAMCCGCLGAVVMSLASTLTVCRKVYIQLRIPSRHQTPTSVGAYRVDLNGFHPL